MILEWALSLIIVSCCCVEREKSTPPQLTIISKSYAINVKLLMLNSSNYSEVAKLFKWMVGPLAGVCSRYLSMCAEGMRRLFARFAHFYILNNWCQCNYQQSSYVLVHYKVPSNRIKWNDGVTWNKKSSTLR